MREVSPTVTRVVDGHLCSGCGICASISGGAISIASVAPGYNRPVQHRPVTDDAESAIAMSCPGAVVAGWEGEALSVHPYWGPWRSVATGHALNSTVRYEGSSGGVLSALLVHALTHNLVDRVIHIGADPINPTRNVVCRSETPEEVIAGAGSRYTASSPLQHIVENLDEGGRFAFVGKPCDVSALRRLSLTDARVATHVPLILSFFCGGIPSEAGVDRILRKMGVPREQLVTFRYRGRGWPGTAAAVTASGDIKEMSYAESWGEYLSKEVQFRCKICPDAVGGVADIACADAWYGGESGYPSFEEQDGRSLVIGRTEAGERLLKAVVNAGDVALSPLAVGEIDLMQPAQARRKRLVLARVFALTVLGRARPDFRGTLLMQAARQAPLAELLKNFVGTLRRVASGRW